MADSAEDAIERDDSSTKDGREAEARKPPQSLIEYLRGKAPASQYVDALVKFVAPRPEETDRAEALRVIESELALVGRLPDLMRSAVARGVPSGTKRTLLGFGAQVIRAIVPEQERWGLSAGATPEALLAPLTRHLRRAREDREKTQQTQAEALFITGFVIALDHHDFDPAGALITIYSGLKTSDPGADNMARLKRVLAKAPVKTVETFALLRHILGVNLDEANAAQRASHAQVQEIRERLRSAQDAAERYAERVKALEVEVAELTQALARAEGSIASVEGGAAHDKFELKGRMRRLMQGSLTAYVNDAHEALREEPYFVEVARERLEMMMDELKQGVAWLDQ